MRALVHPLLTRSLLATPLLAALLACAPDAPTPPGAATVVDVIDGDTVRVRIGGGIETVRLIGIDTPETHHPNKPLECFGPEASAHLAEMLPPGAEVRLERDTEARDRYGRLLAYISITSDDGSRRSVNAEQLRSGHADVLVIAPNTARRDAFADAARTARAAGRGLWAACGGNHVPAGPRTARAG